MISGTRSEVVENGRNTDSEAYTLSKNADTIRGVRLQFGLNKTPTAVLVGCYKRIWVTYDPQPNAYEAVFELLKA